MVQGTRGKAQGVSALVYSSVEFELTMEGIRREL